MPSPTSRTWPTSPPPRRARKFSISLVNTELISSALNFMTASRYEFTANGFEFPADGGVVDPVADAHHQSAQQVGIDPLLQNRLDLEGLAQLADEPLALVGGQLHRRAHLDADTPGPLVAEVAVGRGDGTQEIEPFVFVEDLEEVEESRAGAALEGAGQHLGLFRAADHGGREERLQVGRLQRLADERLELFLDGVGLAVLVGAVEPGLRAHARHEL